MRLYRLFTQNKHKRFIFNLLTDSFDGFTTYETTGFWKRKQEKTLVVEITTNDSAAIYKINRICRAICGYNKQESILLQVSDVKAKLILTNAIQELE